MDNLNKQFLSMVAAATRQGGVDNERLRRIGEYAIKAAYSNNDLTYSQYAMDTLLQYQRKAMASWLRKMGLEVMNPVVGSSSYIVQAVRDRKYQNKAFLLAQSTPVLTQEHKVKAEKQKKQLVGTPLSRAANHIVNLMGRIREDDPECAAFLNDKFVGMETARFVAKDGRVDNLTDAECELVAQFLAQRRKAETSGLLQGIVAAQSAADAARVAAEQTAEEVAA